MAGSQTLHSPNYKAKKNCKAQAANLNPFPFLALCKSCCVFFSFFITDSFKY